MRSILDEMSPKMNKKRGVNRRAIQNKTPIPVYSMTQAQAFESQLAKNADSTVLRGKFFFPQSALTLTPAILTILTPASAAFGARSVSMANLFTSFRFKYLRIKFMLLSSATPVSGAVGVLDDASGAEGDAPSSLNGILEQRCSASSFSNQTTPTEFTWEPVDKRLWYKCFPGSSGSDERLVTSGVLYAATNNPGAVQMEVDFCIVFKGATDVNLT
jgi:hypothetical protein